jgi:hypothetical protein
MSKNKSILFLCLILINQFSVFGFEHSIGLRDDAFIGYKYNFSIVKVIDGRLNKKKPVGEFLWGFDFKSKPVGNDSLGIQMDAFFKNHTSSFDTSTKIILVINQLNLRKTGGGKDESIEISLSLDYYKITGNSCVLLYKHYCKHRESVKGIFKASKAIDVSFSETVRLSFDNVENQIIKHGAMSSQEIDVASFYHSFDSVPKQVINTQNMKDGIYFSIKDVFLNQPGLTAENFFPDTAFLGKKPVSLLSPNYLIARAYAVIRFKRIFIYIRDDYYKEAILSEDGKLFFPDVTQANTSIGTHVGASVMGIVFGSIASAFIPVGGGIAGAVVKGGAVGAVKGGTQAAIKKAGTTYVTSDIIIDYETGNLIPNKP